jgi:hypothetical protein
MRWPPLRIRASVVCLASFLVVGCEGDGSDGAAPRIQRFSGACLPVDGSFPSGLATLPGVDDEAVVVQPSAGNVLGIDLDADPPTLLASGAIPGLPLLPGCSGCGGNPSEDGDGDGIADRCVSFDRGFGCQSAVPGTLSVVDRDFVWLSNSGFEALFAFVPQTSALREIEIETPAPTAAFDPDDWPFWPPPGAAVRRTGFSTRTCVYTDAPDSLGDPVGSFRFCDLARTGFPTGFTAGSAVAGGHLFVATSNLRNSEQARYHPGTLLVFEFDTSVSPVRIRPDPTGAVLFTTGFNPTAVRAYTTPSGRELVLVAVSGAVSLSSGADRIRTDSFVDVFDAMTRTRIATIPLGRAGIGEASIEIDPSGRIALFGAFTSRALFGVDLAALDDPSLGAPGNPSPVALDGGTPGYPDARLWTAEAPFRLPRRAGGPPDSTCVPQTSVAISADAGNAVASEFCDGTISVLDIRLPPDRSTPIDPAAALSLVRVENATAPLIPSATGENRAIGRILFRRGRPGLDFEGPDVYFTVGQTEGAVCGFRINSL